MYSFSRPQSQNRRIRVFVSSTFRDMIEERNALMTHTWPELRRFCRERFVDLVEVDLRWGIAEEQSTRKETLKLCLDEIRACRPFFIGLLGERYGWVPDDDAFTIDLKEEQPWLKNLLGKSITELEILHGVLNNPDMAIRAFFYFRDPAYAKTHGNNFLPENEIASQKQAALKTLIRNVCLEKNMHLQENYHDPNSLALMLLEQLRSAIEIQFPHEIIPDPIDREVRDHEVFAEIRRNTYISRLAYFTALDDHCHDTGNPLLLTGKSGSGKSALIANWVQHRRKEYPRDFIIQHYIGSTADSTSHWKLMTRIIAEIKRWTGDETETPKRNDDIMRDFVVWIAKAKIKAEHDQLNFIVILDALNLLDDKDYASALGWLPLDSFRDNLRLIVSTGPGPTLDELGKRSLKMLYIEPLTPEERGKMIVDYLNRFSKSLDKPRIARLSNAMATANPLYLKILLDELRVTGTYDNLDERLDDYLKATDIPALLHIVLDRYQRDYENDRKGLVGEALGLIWSSRRGLSETELLQLLRPYNLPQLPIVIWSPLRSALEEHLFDRGGILNFSHDFIRSSVESAFVANEAKKDALRRQLVNYFESLPPSARSSDELPWILWKMNDRKTLRNCLLNIERFLVIYIQNESELLQYWLQMGEEREIGKFYIDAFNIWAIANEKNMEIYSSSLKSLGMFLYSASLFSEAEVLIRKSIVCDEIKYGKEHQETAVSLYNLACLLSATNRLHEGEPLFKRALIITEKFFGINHKKVAIILNQLVNLLKATNRLIEAESVMNRALEIDESNYGNNNPIVATDLNNLAEILKYTNRQTEAELCIRRALSIDESYYGKNHFAVARDLSNLAGVIRSLNNLPEVEMLYRKSIKIVQSTYGQNHSAVATQLNNLAHVFVGLKKFNEAESHYRRALEIDEINYGKDHVVVALDLSCLANLLWLNNQLTYAEPLYRRAIEILLNVTKATGFRHSQLRNMIDDYRILIAKTGLNNAVSSALLEKVRPYYFS